MAHDPFTIHGSETVPIALASHVSSVDGGTWSYLPGDNTATINPDGSVSSDFQTHPYYSVAPPGLTYLVQVTFDILSLDGTTFAARGYEDGSGHYYSFACTNGGSLGIFKNDIRTTGFGTTSSTTLTVGRVLTLGIKISPGGIVQGYLDGALVCSGVDGTPLVGPGKGGMAFVFTGGNSPTAGIHATDFQILNPPAAGPLSVSGTSVSGIALALGATVGGTSPFSVSYDRGTDGVTFGTHLATHTNVTGADTYTDATAATITDYYYRATITDAATLTTTSNIFGPVRIFAKYTNPPASPRLDLTGPLATTLQALAVFQDGIGAPPNLVANNLPIRYTGASFINTGEAPLWIASDFPATVTALPTLRFGTNSRTLAYPYGGVGPGSVRTGNSAARTYFCVFMVEAIDSTIFQQLPIFGQMKTIYGASGSGSSALEGLGVAQIGAAGYLCYYTSQTLTSQPLICCDSTGTVPLCPIVPGHYHVAKVSISDAFNPNGDGLPYTRFGLYDLGTAASPVGAEISPQGDQYFIQWGVGPVASKNARRVIGALANLPAGTACDMVVHPEAGIICRVAMCGIDNAYWGNGNGVGPSPPSGIPYSIWQSLILNPYFATTATVNSAGSPPASLVNAGAPTTTNYQGETAYVASSAVSGLPANLPLVAIGDFQITAVNHANSTLQVTDPTGRPHPLTAYDWYYNLAQGSNGTLDLTTSIPYHTFTPPDGRVYYVTCVARDAFGNSYQYQQFPVAIRSRAAGKISLAGNSIYNLGSPLALAQAATAFCEARGFDLCVSIMGIPSTQITDFISGSSTTGNFYGIGGGVINPTDWALICAARELAVTGAGWDAICWQLAGNSDSITEAQYASIGSTCKAGIGVGGTAYGAAIVCVNFVQAIWQHGGHTLASASRAVADQANAIAASDGITIVATGSGPSIASQVLPFQEQGGHPDHFLATMSGIMIVMETPGLAPASGGGGGGGGGTGSSDPYGGLQMITWDTGRTADSALTAFSLAPGASVDGALVLQTGKTAADVGFTVSVASGSFDPTKVHFGALSDIDGTRVEQPRRPSVGDDGNLQPLLPQSPSNLPSSVSRQLIVPATEKSGFRLHVFNGGPVAVLITNGWKLGV